MKGGAQGFVYLVNDVRTNEQYVLKSMLIEEQKKLEFENMIKIWKSLCESENKDFFVKYKDDLYDGEKTSFYFSILMKYDVFSHLKFQ
jgi:hypothetical protein